MPNEAVRPEGLADPGDLLRALEVSAGEAQWTPLFSDDFARTSLGEDWKIVGGQARIENGWLRLSGRADCYAVVRRPFPDSIRVEFEARFPAGMQYCSDLACFLAGDEHRCDAVGYCVSLGADGNTCSRVQRGGVDVRIRPALSAEPGRKYALAAELLGGDLRLFVDGQMILRYVDLVPLAGVSHDRLGLASFKDGCEFANVRVLARSGPAGSGAFTIPDAYCRDGLFDRAIEKYQQVAAAHPGQPLALLAQAKVGLALFAAERWSEAEAQFRGLARQAQGSEIAPLVELRRGQALGLMGKLDEALRVFAHVQAQHSDPGIIDEVAVACGLLCNSLKQEARWLESGRCAKFLFENLKTPLLETNHMFGHYGNRLHEAGLFEEEYLAAARLKTIMSHRLSDPHVIGLNFRVAGLALLTGRLDEARRAYDELEALARGSTGDADLEQRVLAGRVEMDLALGKYERALERLAPLAGSRQEDLPVGETHWGNTFADLRASALVLLGRTDQALEDLDAGRISPEALDLRLILGAELWKRDRKPAAASCFAELGETPPRGTGLFLEKVVPTIRGEAPVELLREFIDSTLQPVLQPLGLFLAGLALWANGEEGAAILSWSEAKNSVPEFAPAWHWSNLYLGRAGK